MNDLPAQLEKRIRRLMRDNTWRGKYGKFAVGAILLAAAAIALMSTLSVARAYPALSKPLPLEAKQKSLIERIIKNTEKRLTDFRYTHVKLEMAETEKVDGAPLKYPSPSKLEAWNDSWSHVFRAQYRPLRFTETASRSDRTNSIRRWVVNKVGRASNGQYYPAAFTVSSTWGKPEATTDFTVSSFEVLFGLPEGITDNPRGDIKGTK
jgi:hypothetical protein